MWDKDGQNKVMPEKPETSLDGWANKNNTYHIATCWPSFLSWSRGLHNKSRYQPRCRIRGGGTNRNCGTAIQFRSLVLAFNLCSLRGQTYAIHYTFPFQRSCTSCILKRWNGVHKKCESLCIACLFVLCKHVKACQFSLAYKGGGIRVNHFWKRSFVATSLGNWQYHLWFDQHAFQAFKRPLILVNLRCPLRVFFRVRRRRLVFNRVRWKQRCWQQP